MSKDEAIEYLLTELAKLEYSIRPTKDSAFLASLTPQQRRIWDLLFKHMGKPITGDKIHYHLYSHRPECDQPEYGSKVIQVLICKIREKLRKAKSKHKISTLYSSGYILSFDAPKEESVTTL